MKEKKALTEKKGTTELRGHEVRTKKTDSIFWFPYIKEHFYFHELTPNLGNPGKRGQKGNCGIPGIICLKSEGTFGSSGPVLVVKSFAVVDAGEAGVFFPGNSCG
jgi:hypothetical protein